MSPSPATLHLEPEGQRLVATFAGELDQSSVPPLEARLRQALAASPRELVVVLDTVTFLDSTALALLFRLGAEGAVHRRALTLVAPPGGPARRLLTLVDIGQAASIVDERPI